MGLAESSREGMGCPLLGRSLGARPKTSMDGALRRRWAGGRTSMSSVKVSWLAMLWYRVVEEGCRGPGCAGKRAVPVPWQAAAEQHTREPANPSDGPMSPRCGSNVGDLWIYMDLRR